MSDDFADKEWSDLERIRVSSFSAEVIKYLIHKNCPSIYYASISRRPPTLTSLTMPTDPQLHTSAKEIERASTSRSTSATMSGLTTDPQLHTSATEHSTLASTSACRSLTLPDSGCESYLPVHDLTYLPDEVSDLQALTRYHRKPPQLLPHERPPWKRLKSRNDL